eukprot:scpid83458/ scgid28914/ 
MGRTTSGDKLHPGQQCGPDCAICKQPTYKFTHPQMIQDWEAIKLSTALPNTACVCWPCVKALRNGCQRGAAGKPAKPLCSVDDCESEMHCHDASQQLMCNLHYNQAYNRPACGMCKQRLQPPRRKSPNFPSIQHFLQVNCETEVIPEDWYCTTCYNAQLNILRDIGGTGDDAPASTDHQLQSLITSIDQSLARGHDAQLVAERFAAEQLLHRGAVLLVTVHEVYEEADKEQTGRNARWLLYRLIHRLDHHASIKKLGASRKHGIMLHRNGSDTLQSLYYSMVEQRRNLLQQRQEPAAPPERRRGDL